MCRCSGYFCSLSLRRRTGNFQRGNREVIFENRKSARFHTLARGPHSAGQDIEGNSRPHSRPAMRYFESDLPRWRSPIIARCDSAQMLAVRGYARHTRMNFFIRSKPSFPFRICIWARACGGRLVAVAFKADKLHFHEVDFAAAPPGRRLKFVAPLHLCEFYFIQI
jgi:hypothetical protein